jgi:SWI/SNF-related matrix-associated actin-dependent regulator 1 of chromatin subfamily A
VSANITLEGGDTFVIRVPKSEALLGRVRALQGRRFDWDRRAWLVPARHVAEVRSLALDLGLSMDDAGMVEASGFCVEGLAQTLRPFQATGVEYASARVGTLIGDEMGLGKTCQAIAAIHHRGAYPAIVVCPAILKENWRREILAWLPGADVEVLSHLEGPTRGAQWTVVNYDIAQARLPRLPTPRALVIDESHLIKERSAQRTSAVLALSHRMPPDALRLCLTGTAILSRPIELETQLEALQQLEAFGGADAFEATFCGKRTSSIQLRNPRGGRPIRRTILKLDGATNLALLNTLLRQRCMVRRLKADVLPELPPKVRSVHWGDSAPELYLAEEQHAREELRAKAADLAQSMGIDVASLAESAEWGGFCSNALGELAKLRRALAGAKLPMVIHVAEHLLSGGCGKLVIFGHHRDLTEALAAHFSCPAILGGMAERQRQAAVDAFQAPEGPAVIVCSIQAAGYGITLTAASNVLMAELAWTPGVLEQAEDRLHRIGQRDSVTAWYALVPDTIDEMMWELLERKRAIVGQVTDGTMQAALVKRMVVDA